MKWARSPLRTAGTGTSTTVRCPSPGCCGKHPRREVPYDVLLRLLSPGQFQRRVTISYRILPTEEGQAVVEREVNAAEARDEYRRRTQRTATRRERVDAANAERSAMEEATGSAMVQWSIYVTTTVSSEAELPAARREVEKAAPAPRAGCASATPSAGRRPPSWWASRSVSARCCRSERVDHMPRKSAGKDPSRPMQGAGTGAGPDTTEWRLNPRVIARRMGWPGVGAGKSANLDAGAVYQSTTKQTAGLYPFVLGAGMPAEGVPIGPDLLTHELVCLDPSGWIGRLVTNPGVWVQAQPGVGKSAITKRICLVYSAYGYKITVPGDVKGEYAPLVRALGGQVVRIGRGLDKLNPLDSGPLRKRLPNLAPERREALLAELNGRRSELLHALLATNVALGRRPLATEAAVVNHAIRLVSARLLGQDPVIPDIVKVLRDGPKELQDQVMVTDDDAYRDLVREVVAALENLTSGPLAGLFDGQTTTPLDLDAPALSVDLSPPC